MLKSESILALDIGASGIKLAEFVALKSGGLELVNYAVGSLGMDPQSEGDRSTYLVTTIRELLQDSGIRPGTVLISVSGQSVFSRFVKLPPVDKDKVYQIILYEAQQNVPFPIDEVVWDYQLIGGAGGEVDVMLAAIKADIIEQLSDTVESAGMRPDLIDVAPMALYNAVRYNYTDLPACTLLIDIGARSTDLIFIEAGRVFSRSVPVAGNAITQQIMQEFNLSFADAEQMKMAHAFVAFGGAYEGPKSETVDKVSKSVRSVMTRLHAEINRSINFYRSQQSGQQPQLVLLTGGTSVIPYTDTFLKEKLKVDVDYMNPFLNVAVSERIPAEQIGRHAHTLGQVVGLALRRELSCPIEINLMPPKVVQQKAFRKKQPLFVASAVVLFLVLTIWCGYFLKMTSLAQARLDRVKVVAAALESVESQLRSTEQQRNEIDEKIRTTLHLVDRRSQWLKVLDEINQCLPDGMWLQTIRPTVSSGSDAPTGATPPQDPSGEAAAPQGIRFIELNGAGYIDKVSSEAISKFRDKLRTMSLFDDQTEIRWQPAPGPDDVILEFRIIGVLKKPLEV
ncbi:MAG TPA: hypothetical protein DCZ95_12765 [Verrucomicrobia bacterium]|nr:MAG: hypothetical protein A2X46_11895 [Lentisphaerae bacterium GWF2_57_35]HBA84959.1 hypothetical protein [Verrucomicrobiota bacterium]